MPIGPIPCHTEGQPSHESSCHHLAHSLSFSEDVLLDSQLLAALPALLQGGIVRDWGLFLGAAHRAAPLFLRGDLLSHC